MFKLIFFLAGLAIAIVFSALNIGNSSDISFGFRVLKDAPVFLTIMVSFLAGAVFTLPFAFSVSINKKRIKKKSSKAEFIPDSISDEIIKNDAPDTEV